MSKKQKYNLIFSRVKVSGFSDILMCTEAMASAEAYALSGLLYSLGKREGPTLLEEIDNALNNLPFEEYYSVDNATLGDGVQIVPPNAIINQQVQVSLIDLRGLVEEWVEFVG